MCRPDVPPQDALWTIGEIGAEFDFLLIIRSQPAALAVLIPVSYTHLRAHET